MENSEQEILNRLYKYRDQIENCLAEMDAIFMVYFSNQYHIFYQHIIPQIKTALRNDTKWLSRGQYSMDDIFKNIEDNMKIENNKGVSKFIN